MKNTMKSKLAVMTMAGVVGCAQVQAAGDFEAGIGYMESSERGFGFIKAQGVVYEGPSISHKLGLEYIGYDETLNSALDTSMLFSTIVVNYEIELHMSEVLSVFGGVGLGGQHVSLDSPAGELDDDFNSYAQFFVGARARLSQNLDFKAGIRKMFFDDYELQGVSGIKQEHTWAFDAGLTFRF